MKYNPQNKFGFDKDQVYTTIKKFISVILPKGITRFDFSLTKQPGNYYASNAIMVVPDEFFDKYSQTIVNRFKDDSISEITTKIAMYLGFKVYFTRVQIIKESDFENIEI
jgi:hypothetical protein